LKTAVQRFPVQGVLEELDKRLRRGYTSHLNDPNDDDEDGEDDAVGHHCARSMLTFPFRAIEALVATVLHSHEVDMVEVTASVKAMLRLLEANRPVQAIAALEALRALKLEVEVQEQRAQLTKQAFDEILQDDLDM
jgi:hypothetical protein